MKVLLTGASGFIGRNIKEAYDEKYQIKAPSRKELDLLDSESVENYLHDEKFEVVIHAANTNQVVHPESADKVLDYNLRMFCNLQRCAHMYNKLYYFGSGAEYGTEYYIPRMKERYLSKHIPSDSYGFSKYLMAIMAENSDNIYEFCLFGVFGKYEEWTRRFISNIIYQCMNSTEIHMDRHMYFDYLFVDDLITILDWFLNHEPLYHRYHLCTGQQYDLFELASMVKEELGCSAKIVMNSKEWKKPYTGDNGRLISEIGQYSFKPMRIAIREMANYYKEHGFSEN